MKNLDYLQVCIEKALGSNPSVGMFVVPYTISSKINCFLINPIDFYRTGKP